MRKLGNKITELARKKLAWGCAVMVITQILGFMPSVDFLPTMYHKYASFGLGLLLTVMKGVEMYYEKTEQLVKTGEIEFDTEILKKEETKE